MSSQGLMFSDYSTLFHKGASSLSLTVNSAYIQAFACTDIPKYPTAFLPVLNDYTYRKEFRSTKELRTLLNLADILHKSNRVYAKNTSEIIFKKIILFLKNLPDITGIFFFNPNLFLSV